MIMNTIPVTILTDSWLARTEVLVSGMGEMAQSLKHGSHNRGLEFQVPRRQVGIPKTRWLATSVSCGLERPRKVEQDFQHQL